MLPINFLYELNLQSDIKSRLLIGCLFHKGHKHYYSLQRNALLVVVAKSINSNNKEIYKGYLFSNVYIFDVAAPCFSEST